MVEIGFGVWILATSVIWGLVLVMRRFMPITPIPQNTETEWHCRWSWLIYKSFSRD